ncbi:MAG: TVP38/TMEM64 family protein [Syntrophomonadaceae bacterium]|nr:TVP38/TMEM64 family protein [Syntrophomonadaceae bacterium]
MELLSINNISIAMVSNYIKGFGFIAPLIAFCIFIVQAALPIFPYIILAAAGGLLFGFKMGFLLSWLGALVGACLAYWFCKQLGSEWTINTIRSRFGYDLRNINNNLAFWVIILARIIPVTPTPIINAAAALGGVPFWNFFLSSAIGKIPAALLYTGLGLCLFKLQDIKLTLCILAFIIVIVFIGHYLTKSKFFSH